MLKLSVILATRNRAESLREVLRSLSAQTLPASDYEVVVVDDGSTDETSAVLQEPWPLRLRAIRQENRGATYARNRAAKAAHGGLLVLIDDDMSLDRLYLEATLDLHSAPEPRLGMGACLPDLDRPGSRFQRIQAVVNADKPPFEAESEVPFTACVTNNLSIRRDVLFSIGGFRNPVGDPAATWGDVELGYRAHRHGVRCWRSGRALCVHRDHTIHSFQSGLQRSRRIARLAPALIQGDPALRGHLPMFDDKWPMDFGQDSAGLLARKLLRHALSVAPMPAALQALARIAAAVSPADALVRPFYRWALGVELYRGLREGLREAGSPRLRNLSQSASRPSEG